MRNIALLMTLAALAFSTSVQAQGKSSAEVLATLSQKAKDYPSIQAEFTSRIEDKQSGIDITQDGSIKLKGEKYAAKLDIYEIYSDGESITTFDSEANEAMVDYVEDVEDGSLTPSKIFTLWEEDFKHEMMGEEAVEGADCYKINLYPNDPKDKSFHTITMFVNKTKMEVARVIVKGKDGSDMTYTVTKFDTSSTLPDSTFAFSKSAHPGVVIIDNR